MHCKAIQIFLFFFFCTFQLKAQFNDSTSHSDTTEEFPPMRQLNVDMEHETTSKFGVKFTLGMAKFRGNAFDNEIFRFAGGVGMYQIIPLNKAKKSHIQWEINYNGRGSKFKHIDDTSY